MSKSAALLLLLAILTAPCVMVTKPALSSDDAAEDSWEPKAPMQVARSGLGVAVVNGKIYAIGGSTVSGANPNTVGTDYTAKGWIVDTNEEYNPATNTWTFKTPMPTPRFDFAITAYQNKIYCIGGISDYTVPTANRTGVNEVYDPATNTWETKAPMPTARAGLQANVVNGRIYLIGRYPDYTLNEVYDPVMDSWTTKAPLPTAVNDYASAVVDNKIYIIGGISKDQQHNLNQIYDTETDTWSYGTPPLYSCMRILGAKQLPRLRAFRLLNEYM